jgi:hypothetical protein
MNLETPLQTLKFLWLKWPIGQVEYWLNYPTPGLDFFLFDFHFPATTDPSKPLGLCVFAHNSINGVPGYFNPYNPEVLLPYESNALLLSGPIKLTSNMLSVDDIRAVLAEDPSQKEYLLFTPNLNADNQVYYNVTAEPATLLKGGGVRTKDGTPLKGGGPGGTPTNPSPPATSTTSD